MTPLIGSGNLSNVLAATAVAVELDVPLAAIAERASRLTPAPHRGEVLRLADGVTVIDDSYNANPSATRRALELLGGSVDRTRRVAVLGEMLELGRESARLHQDVGRAAAAARVDALIAVGGEAARALADGAIEAGVTRANVRYVATSDEAADIASALVRPGDLAFDPKYNEITVTYGTAEAFLVQFGLESVAHLPGLDELKAAGFLEAIPPSGFDVPSPSDELGPDEDPYTGEEPEDLATGSPNLDEA